MNTKTMKDKLESLQPIDASNKQYWIVQCCNNEDLHQYLTNYKRDQY